MVHSLLQMAIAADRRRITKTERDRARADSGIASAGGG
jgi:hypothetical protein